MRNNFCFSTKIKRGVSNNHLDFLFDVTQRNQFVIWWGMTYWGNGYNNFEFIVEDGFYFADHRDAIEFKLRFE
jgi:hypothetical protein